MIDLFAIDAVLALQCHFALEHIHFLFQGLEFKVQIET